MRSRPLLIPGPRRPARLGAHQAAARRQRV